MGLKGYGTACSGCSPCCNNLLKSTSCCPVFSAAKYHLAVEHSPGQSSSLGLLEHIASLQFFHIQHPACSIQHRYSVVESALHYLSLFVSIAFHLPLFYMCPKVTRYITFCLFEHFPGFHIHFYWHTVQHILEIYPVFLNAIQNI